MGLQHLLGLASCPAPAVQLLLGLLWALGGGPGAGSVCPSCGGPTLTPQEERALVLELAKQQILGGLHLPSRPQIPRPPPRAALSTALRRLQPRSAQPSRGQELISFAEVADSAPAACSSVLTFRLSPSSPRLRRARLWLHVAPTRSGTFHLRLLGWGTRRRQLEPRVLLAERSVSRPGWLALTLPPRRLRAGASSVLKLQVDCSPADSNRTAAPQSPRLLDTGGEQRPFLELKIRPRVPGAGRARRRTPTCQPETPLCCRRDHYVDFQELGWRDWILQPEGYQLNYCSGQCPPHLAGSPGIAASFHSAVFSLLKANNPWPTGASCCTPTARRPLSLLYLDRNGNVVKTDVPDMVVEACDCS